MTTPALSTPANSAFPSRGRFGKVGYTCHREVADIRGSVSGFQTIATRRDGLKNPRDKSETSPFASFKWNLETSTTRHDTTNGLSHTTACLADRGRVTSKKWGSRRRRGQINGDVTGLSLTSRRSRNSGIWALLTSLSCFVHVTQQNLTSTRPISLVLVRYYAEWRSIREPLPRTVKTRTYE